MIYSLKKIVRAIKHVFRWMPKDEKIRHLTNYFDKEKKTFSPRSKLSYKIAIQGPHDTTYYALFSSLIIDLRRYISVNSEVILVNSINSAVGVGYRQKILRSWLIKSLIGNQWARAYEKTLGSIGYTSHSLTNPLLKIQDWFRANQLWSEWRHSGGIATWTVDNIILGDLIIDTYLRYRPSPKFIISDVFVRSIIWQALSDIRKSRNYFKKEKPDLYISSYSTYIEHGILARVAIAEGIVVRTYGSAFAIGKKLDASDHHHTANTSDFKFAFSRLTNPETAMNSAESLLRYRLAGGVDTATIYMKSSAYGHSDEKIPFVKDYVVIFLHDFYDSPHVYKNLIFSDFWSWATYTIDALIQAKIDFIIKPHPNQIPLSDVALNELREAYPGIQIISSKIDNTMLVQAGIKLGITAYGTVAHELAYLGVPSICCAQHPHHTFNFCLTASNIYEYGKILNRINEIEFSLEIIHKEALQFFYMYNIYGGLNIINLRKAYSNLMTSTIQNEVESRNIIDKIQKLRSEAGWFEHLQEIKNDLILNRQNNNIYKFYI